MSVALKFRGLGRHIGDIVLALSIVFATSACTTHRPRNAPVASGVSGAVKPLVMTVPNYPFEAAIREDKGVCVSSQLTLTTSGRVANFKVVGAYPSLQHVQEYGYVNAIRQTVREWRFASQFKGADFNLHSKLMQTMVFTMVPPGTVSSDLALSLVCKQPYLLTLKPIAILFDSASQQASSESAAALESKGGTVAVAGMSVSIPPVAHIARFWQGTQIIRAQFCVDPQKRIANVILKGGTPEGQAVALSAISELPVAAARSQQSASQPQQLPTIHVTGSRIGDESLVQRMEQTENKVRIAGIPIWACGLRVSVRLFAKPRGGTIGLIKRTSFGQLSGESNMPPIIASHSTHQKLAVAAGAKLPDEARIEVEFCITPEGIPITAHVVSAKPDKILIQGALKVVAGWRFARRRHKMCNVYQQVGFKIPHSVGGA